MAGVFIALEGGDGGGKSTQVVRLAAALRERGHTVVATREPGGTPIAEDIRRIILDPANMDLSDRTEALLYAASRAEHVHHVVRPALERGEIVISDRYMDSSIVYQGMGRGLGVAEVQRLNLWATDNLLPDVTIVLDVDAGFGLERVGTPDRLELAPRELHERVRSGYLELAAADPARYLVVDAGQSIDVIADIVLTRVLAAIEAGR